MERTELDIERQPEIDLDAGLMKARRSCGIIRRVFSAISIVFVAAWLAALATVLISCSGLGASSTAAVFSYLLGYGAVAIFFMFNLVGIFSEVEKGNSPFSDAQALRVKNIALAALLIVLVDLLFSVGAVFDVVPLTGYELVVNDGVTEPTINLNIGMLVFSAIMYSLSVIFRYAALLQQLSDDTV
ncbi:MAG: hypothetical protein HFJ72_09030 [Adlercreutzia sp.]|nr:hypothetical protein [Adlercreutzia sp.]